MGEGKDGEERAPGSHKGDERKSGAIRMMPFARSSSLSLSLSPDLHPLLLSASTSVFLPPLSSLALAKYRGRPSRTIASTDETMRKHQVRDIIT